MSEQETPVVENDIPYQRFPVTKKFNLDLLEEVGQSIVVRGGRITVTSAMQSAQRAYPGRKYASKKEPRPDGKDYYRVWRLE